MHSIAVVHDAFDGPEIASVIGQILVLAGVLVSVGYGRNANVNAKAARAQVENDHKTNFREDADEKHEDQKKQIEKVQRGQDRIVSELHGLRDDLGDAREDIGLLKDGWASNRHRIENLEDTENRRREAREWGPPPPAGSRRERRYGNVQ